MAISKKIKLENDTEINYIRIEFLYAYNEKNNKSVLCRIGLYVAKDSKIPVEVREYNYAWKELEYTGSEELFSLVYNKLKKSFTGSIDIV